MNTHEVITYTPTALMPANGLQAVWCEVCGENELFMWASPLDFVGLAEAAYKHYAKPLTSLDPIKTHVERGVLIGIYLADGVAEIANDQEDFCGFARPGDDLSDFTVPAKYADRKRVVA